MAKWKLETAVEDRERMQREFEETAEQMGIKLADPETVANEPVGALVACVMGLPLAKITGPPPSLDTGDEEENSRRIHAVIEAWETCTPDTLLDVWQTYAAQPAAMALTAEWIGAVDGLMLAQGIESETYKAQLRSFPFASPRDVSLHNVQMMFITPSQAVATYRVEERYTNGEVWAANSVMILMQDPDLDWKVALYTKHTHDKDLRPVNA